MSSWDWWWETIAFVMIPMMMFAVVSAGLFEALRAPRSEVWFWSIATGCMFGLWALGLIIQFGTIPLLTGSH